MELIVPKKTEPSSFYLTFVGEYVQIITDVKFNSAGSPNKQAGAPLIIEGILMDADDQYVYLSQDGSEIRQALKSDVIVYVQISGPSDEFSEFLGEIPDMKKGDMN
jgi:hypothetical protein